MRRLLPALQIAVTIAIAPACALIFSGSAEAGGFAIREQSTSALSTSFAGAAAETRAPSHMFFNPATIAWSEGLEIQINAPVFVPSLKFKNGSAFTLAGTPVPGNPTRKNALDVTFIPSIYATVPVLDDLTLGLAINAPFGVVTKYDQNSVARYHALTSSLKTVNFNPVVAYRINNRLAVAGGLMVEWIDARLTTAIDFGTLGAAAGVPFAAPGTQDGVGRVQGDDVGFGFTLGAMFIPMEGTQIGIGYRSQVKHTLKGRGKFTLDSAGVGTALQAGAAATLPPGIPPPFTDSGISARITLPDVVSVGLSQRITPSFTVLAGAEWTDWSDFKELRIKFDNPVQPDNVTRENWNDGWLFSLGGRWQATDNLLLSGGAAYEKSPVPDATRTPRIPDDNRIWLSIGADYEFRDGINIGAAYTHLFFDQAAINLSPDSASDVRGTLTGDTRSSISILSLSAKIQF